MRPTSLAAVAELSALECFRETMRLALEKLGGGLSEKERPNFWPMFWEGYVENKLDYKSGLEVLKNKHRQAGVLLASNSLATVHDFPIPPEAAESLSLGKNFLLAI